MDFPAFDPSDRYEPGPVTLDDLLESAENSQPLEDSTGIIYTDEEFEEHLRSQPFVPASDPQGDVDSICGMVTGTPFDMARDGERIVGEAVEEQRAGRVQTSRVRAAPNDSADAPDGRPSELC